LHKTQFAPPQPQLHLSPHLSGLRQLCCLAVFFASSSKMFASESILSFRTVPSEFYDDQGKRVLSIALRWGESARDVVGYELQVSTDEKNFASHAKFSSDVHYFE